MSSVTDGRTCPKTNRKRLIRAYAFWKLAGLNLATRTAAEYCCELLSTAGLCVARRMFGGYGISTDGLTLSILADLGQGEKLWLKADTDSIPTFESAGCERFTYLVKGKPQSMGYYSAPDDAMESAQEMAPWARLALQAALAARQPKGKRSI